MHRFDAAATGNLLDYRTLLQMLTAVLAEYRRQEITSPERLVVPCGNGGFLFSMPCQAKDLVAHKLITQYNANKARGLPTIQGDVTCFDAANGVPLFCLDAATTTARRTAAVSMLGVRLLRAAPPASCLLIGTGAQAQAHAEAALELFPDLVIHVRGRTPGAAAAFCEATGQPGRVVPVTVGTPPDTDLVIALTTSGTPVFDADPIPGRLVIGAGAYRPDMAEIGPRIVRGSQLYVDDMVGAPGEAGDLITAGIDWATVKPLATALDTPPDGTHPVFFKSVGCAAWDLAACRTARANLDASRGP